MKNYVTAGGRDEPFRVLEEIEPSWWAGLVEVPDGAQLFIEVKGQGRPVLFIHGWTMSGRFWKYQIDALADQYRVVTLDLRGHGRSSKVFHGHTVPQYARDIRGVIKALGLEGAILVGWSLAGPVVLEYLQNYGDWDLAAVCLVEMTPFPFGSPDWNTHALAGVNFDQMEDNFQAMQTDRTAFGRRFIGSMFQLGRASEKDMAWMLREYLSTPTPVAMAIYSDYLLRDYTPMLKRISLPVLAINGTSDFNCFGEKTGRFVADRIPCCQLSVFKNSGHMPFYEEPDRFNQEFIDFMAKV